MAIGVNGGVFTLPPTVAARRVGRREYWLLATTMDVDYRWWPERRWCNNATSSNSSSSSSSSRRPDPAGSSVGGQLGSLHLGDLGGLFIALAVTLAATTGVSVAQWFWCRRHRALPGDRRNKPSTGNRLPLSQLRNTVR